MKNSETDMLRKNVLIIVSDEQRVDTLGCYGNDRAKTPNIDSLADEGVRFDSCYTAYPLCCPARASLWSAMMPHNHHVLSNWVHIRPELRDGGIVSRFAEQGYHTTYTGKWHVPGTTPERMGYRSCAAIPDVVDGRDRGRYITEYREYARSQGYELVEHNIENLTVNDLDKKTKNGNVIYGTSDISLDHYIETWQTGKFLQQMEECPSDQPFFAVCAYNAPHFPMLVPEPYDRLINPDEVLLPPNFGTGLEGKPDEVIASKHYQLSKDLEEREWRELTAHYWGLCSLVDSQVGRIVEWLKANGKYEDTIIVYVSDHGDMMGSHALNLKGFELQYEETNRVPLVIAHPDLAGRQSRKMLVSLIDLMPTLADLCNIDIRQAVDGVSFAGSLLEDGSDRFREYVICESFETDKTTWGSYENPEEYTADDWRVMNVCIRTDRDKYVFHGKDRDEYYDLEADPLENENLFPAGVDAERVHTLRELILSDLDRSTTVLSRIVREKMDTK